MDEPTKICSRCPEGQNVYPVSQFFKNNANKDGLFAYCKACHAKAEARPERVAQRKAYKALYHELHAEKINARSVQWGKDHPERMNAKNKRSYKKRIAEQVAAGERDTPRVYQDLTHTLATGRKACSRCEMVKPLADFYEWKRSTDGVQSECKACHDDRSQPMYPRDESIVEKTCTQCAHTKPASEFYDNPYVHCGMHAACKVCTNAANDAWAAANPEKHKAIANGYARKARQDPQRGPIIRARLHRRRALLKHATIIDEVIDSAVLYVRDKGICSLCNTYVPKGLKWPEPMAATMDHIIPLTKGGEHSWKNVALAHFICNTRKNNRIQTQQMRLF